MVPTTLSTHPLPPMGDRHDNFMDFFTIPAIPPSIADNNRRFYPSLADAHPSDLFAVRCNLCSLPGYRFIHKDNQKQMLMFIDGACCNDGSVDALGGCGVVFSSTHWAQPIAYPLENDGITHTSNHAELRAALLALGLRVWNGEGFNSVVLACDSQYVVCGASEYLNEWINNGWVANNGTPVKNRDLWEKLLEKMRHLESYGVQVQFWLIPREWNEAGKYAKDGAVGSPTSYHIEEHDHDLGPIGKRY